MSSSHLRHNPAERASAHKLALAVVRHSGLHVVLYDPERLWDVLAAPLKRKEELIDRLQDKATRFVVGYVALSIPYDGPKIIQASGAKPGFGPMTYDAALWEADGPVMPDAEASAEARRVWSFYRDKRHDVTSSRLRAGLWSKHDELNRAYTLQKKPVGLTAMLRRNRDFMDDAGLPPAELDRALAWAGEVFFGTLYRGRR